MEQSLILLLCTCHCTDVPLSTYMLRGLNGIIYQAKCVALLLHAMGIILFDNLHHSCPFHVTAGSRALDTSVVPWVGINALKLNSIQLILVFTHNM